MMAFKVFAVLLLAVAVSRGQAITEITLPDEEITHISNPLIGRAITIPKLFLDELVACNIIFPNGITYEAYPNSNIPNDPYIFFANATSPFRSCSVGFRGVTTDFSGTYELISLIQHSDDSMTLTNKKFHITFLETDLVFP